MLETHSNSRVQLPCWESMGHHELVINYYTVHVRFLFTRVWGYATIRLSVDGD